MKINIVLTTNLNLGLPYSTDINPEYIIQEKNKFSLL